MKKLIVIVVAAFIVLPSFSQLNWGIKAGLSTNSISMEQVKSIPATGGNYTIAALKSATYGFHGGLFFRLTIFGLYVQPEVLIATSENKYNVTNPGSVQLNEVTQSLTKLSIPVMVGLKFGPLRINAGPAANVQIGSPKALITDTNFKDLQSKTTIGYQAGLGLDIFKKITIDVRYEGNLKKYQNQIQNLTGSTKINLDNRPNAFLFSLGLLF
jgi:hypothetical protein